MSTDTMAGATEFAHMLLKVSDIKRSERFYVDLLGFTIRPAKPLPDGRPFVPFKHSQRLWRRGGMDELLQSMPGRGVDLKWNRYAGHAPA